MPFMCTWTAACGCCGLACMLRGSTCWLHHDHDRRPAGQVLVQGKQACPAGLGRC